jgi:hypothetical protein
MRRGTRFGLLVAVLLACLGGCDKHQETHKNTAPPAQHRFRQNEPQ